MIETIQFVERIHSGNATLKEMETVNKNAAALLGVKLNTAKGFKAIREYLDKSINKN